MQDYNQAQDPFRNLTEDLTLYGKLKFVFPGLVAMPLRLTCGISCVAASAIVMKLFRIGLPRFKKGSKPQPLRGWRLMGPKLVNWLCRGLLFNLGFYWIHVTGKPAPRNEAPIVVSNHISPWDSFALMHFSDVVFVSRIENAKIPIFGSCIRGLQFVLVDRDNATSRDGVVEEIKRRATEPGWPALAIFPEGTVSNGKALLQFRTGAFQPGVPVQPVIIRYRFKYCDPSWAGTRVGLGALALRMVSQFFNTMEITYLPVYVPSEAEKTDPVLYAANVRKYMSDHSGIPLSNYSIEDYVVLTEAKKYGIRQADAVLGVESLRRATNLNSSDVKQILKSFHEMDKEKTGLITYEAFLQALGIPDHPTTRTSFAHLCAEGSNEINFRTFLQSVVHLSRNITTDEKLRVAFEITNIRGDGKITEDELGAVISIVAPEMPKSQIHNLFRRMDTRRVGFVDFVEFGAFFRANPHYMQLFETAREVERAKGQNAVLDMLKKREEGKTMSVDEFRESVTKYREKESKSS